MSKLISKSTGRELKLADTYGVENYSRLRIPLSFYLNNSKSKSSFLICFGTAF